MFARATYTALFLVAFLGACTQTTNPGPVAGQVGPEGGTVKSADGRAVLVIPKDALTTKTTFTLAPSNQANKAPAGKLLVPGSLYSLGADRSTAKPLTLSLQYDPVQVEALSRRWGVSIAAAANTLELVRLVDNTWQTVPAASVDAEAKKVSASINQLGVYALLVADGARPKDTIGPEGGVVVSSDGHATLNVPTEALTAASTLTIAPSNQVNKAPLGKVLVPGSLYSLGGNNPLSKPATLSIQYDPTQVESLSQKWGVSISAAANALELVRLVEGNWQAVGGADVDEQGKKVSASISEYGVYGLLAPDGSRPNWKLDVRGGIANLSNEIKNSNTLSGLVGRSYLYLAPGRNGSSTLQPLAIKVTGANNYSGSIVFETGRYWDIFTASISGPGSYEAKAYADGQEIAAPFELKSSNLLPLPVFQNLAATATGIQASWAAVPGAQNYQLRVYDFALNLLGQKTGTATSVKLDVAKIPPTGYAVFLIAYNWDINADRTQPLTDPPSELGVSATYRTISSTPPPQPKLGSITPSSLTLAAQVGQSASNSISFGNQGNGTLEYTTSLSGSGFGITQGGSGTVYGFSNGNIVVQGSCPASATTLTGTLTLNTNDPAAPSTTIPLTLECVKPLQTNLVFSRITPAAVTKQIRFSPDGSKIATHDSAQIIIWNTSGKVLRTFEIGKPNFCCADNTPKVLEWSPDGSKLAGSVGNTIAKIWNAESGSELLTLDGLTRLSALAWNPGGSQIAAAVRVSGPSTEAVIYNASTGAEVKSIKIKPSDSYDNVVGIAWNSAGTSLITSATGLFVNPNLFALNVRVWDISTGTQTLVVTTNAPEGMNTVGNPAAISAASNRAVGIYQENYSSPQQIEVKSLADGNLIKRFGSYGGVFWTGLSSDGSQVGVGYGDKFDIWDVAGGNLLTTLTLGSSEGFTNVYNMPAWRKESGKVAVPLFSKLIRVIDTTSKNTDAVLGYHPGSITDIDFTADGKVISSTRRAGDGYGDINYGALAWSNMVADQTLNRLLFEKSDVMRIKVLEGGKLATVLKNDTGSLVLKTFSTLTGEQLGSISLPFNSLRFDWNPAGSRILYWDANSTPGVYPPTIIEVSNTSNSISLKDLSIKLNEFDIARYFRFFVWNADGSKVLGFSTSHIGIWDGATGERVSTVQLKIPPYSLSDCFYAEWTLDTSKVACATDSSITIFDALSGNLLYKSDNSSNLEALKPLGWNPTGKYLALSVKAELRIITASGATIANIPYSYPVGSYNSYYSTVAKWSPDGKYLAVGDSPLRVWEIKGQP